MVLRTMAVVTLEDLQGSMEVVVFPKLFEQTGPIWADGSILLVAGRIDHLHLARVGVGNQIERVPGETQFPTGIGMRHLKIVPDNISNSHGMAQENLDPDQSCRRRTARDRQARARNRLTSSRVGRGAMAP